jgi:hypothetical protein
MFNSYDEYIAYTNELESQAQSLRRQAEYHLESEWDNLTGTQWYVNEEGQDLINRADELMAEYHRLEQIEGIYLD